MTRMLLAVVAAIDLLAVVPASFQQTAASRITLAIVSDSRNRAIVDVGADDFLVQEAGQAREVLSVRVADYPIVVLLDDGAEASGDFPQMRKAVERFVERLGPRPLAIGTLGDPPKILMDLADERQKVVGALDAIEVSATAKSMMLRGAARGGEAIQATGALFSALVVLSATANDASPGEVDGLIAPIVDSRAVLHVVANRSATLAVPASQAPSDRVLRSIAERTRGEFTTIYSPASYQAALDKLADRLTSEMMIEYLVPPGSKPVDVKVGVRVPGAKVRGLGVAPR